MHVLVTGATGFVGSAVIKALLSAGHAVTGSVRDPRQGQSARGFRDARGGGRYARAPNVHPPR